MASIESKWFDIYAALSVAIDRLQRANARMEELGTVEHIRENLLPTIESAERFCQLAHEKYQEVAEHGSKA